MIKLKTNKQTRKQKAIKNKTCLIITDWHNLPKKEIYKIFNENQHSG